MESEDTDAERLANNTHLSVEEARILLNDRTLTGDPTNDKWSSHIVITPKEVVLKQPSNAGRGDLPTAVEMAEATGATVEQIRLDRQAFDNTQEHQ